MRKRSIKNLQTLKPWNLHSKGERHLSAFSATLPQESHANGTASEDYFAMIQATLILQKENRHRKSEEQESTELLFWNLNHLWNEKTLRQIKQKWQTRLYSNLRQEAIDFLDASVENRPSWEAATVFTLKRLAFLEWACSLEGSLKIQRTLVLGDGRKNCVSVFWTEMCLKYFEVIMLVNFFLNAWWVTNPTDPMKYKSFVFIRQEYGNIKKRQRTGTLTNFSDVMPFARKIEEASVWHMSHEKDPAQGEAWSHLCLCTKEDGWLEVWFGMFDGTKRFKWFWHVLQEYAG